ncbi:MAG: DUF2723 domain-containing protein [Gemmatimonadaceae bacterium]|nr:DUF2723 domain-containing protein [Gemmatimonadaceae bacterium]
MSDALAIDERPSYTAALAVGLGVFLLYLVTLSPSTAMWDASEYIAAAYTFGLPHPPGNPFFVIIGRFFAVLPISENVAWKINVLNALASSASAAMWFLITERVLTSWLPKRWMRITGGALAALIGATAFTVWNQSVVNEKVYCISLVGLAISCWLVVRWCDDPDGPKADRLLVLTAYLMGLGYANHMAGFLTGPALLVAVAARRPKTFLRWRLILAGTAALILGLTPFATQPIRAAFNPPLNEGQPTACREGLKFDCTFSKGTYDAFMYNFNRGQYGKPELSERQAPFTAQLGMWWLYFKWQWIRDYSGTSSGLQASLAAVFFVLGLLGGWVHWTRDRRSFWFFGPLVFSLTLLLIFYLNFKYGASQAPELGDTVAREVRDRDYFYLWSFSAWSVWAALGLVFVWETIAAAIGRESITFGGKTVELPSMKGWMAGTPVLALAFIPLVSNWTVASRAGHTDTRDFAHDLLNSVEPYGILVTVGDNDTFPLWYAQEVEGIRKDVIIANTSLLNTDWYTRQLIIRPTFEYDAAKGPALYRGKTWPKPSKPALNMSMTDADKVPLYFELTQAQVFEKGGIRAVLAPQTLGKGYLERADIFVLRYIQDAFPERPIYFSRTSASYGEQLGLGDYLLTQGLARKLLTAKPTTGRDTVAMQGQGYVDVARTKALWDSVFVGQASLIKKGNWVDRPSVGIPYLYVSTGLVLSDIMAYRGDSSVERAKVLETTRQLARAMNLGEVADEPPPLPVQDSPAKTAVPSKGGGQ